VYLLARKVPGSTLTLGGNATVNALPRILAVDDDPAVCELLEDYLSDNGFAVLTAADTQTARKVLDEHAVSAVLLDVGLPGEDGLSFARYLREHHDVAIIMVSGAGDTLDRIIGLEVGADDYVSKPFEPRELLARLKSVIRRYQRTTPPGPGEAAAPSGDTRRIAFGRCTLDIDTYQLFGPDGGEIPITNMEFDLLRVFADRPNRALSRDQLLNLTQNRDWDPFDRSIDIRIARLRKKIESDPEKPQVIKTLRGVGYIYIPAG
jgi:two-component system phosphate regulon response regulator OmpR